MDISLNNTFLDTVDKYYDYITEICGNKCIVFMDGTDERIGTHKKSDIILIFNRTGEILVSCERLLRADYSFFEFLFLKIKYLFKFRGKSCGNKCVSIYRDRIDVIEYKSWWWQWAENLL